VTTFNYQTVGYAGTDLTFSAPTGGVAGDAVFPTDDRGFFWVENAAAGGTITVVISTPGTSFGGMALPDISVSIPDGERRLIGPLTAGLGDPAALGAVIITITPNVTGVTAAAVKVP